MCPKCGANLGYGWQGPCPKCGNEDLRISNPLVTNYSGTVVLSGSTFSAFNAIMYAKGMLASVAESDPKRAPFVQPIIDQLDMAA